MQTLPVTKWNKIARESDCIQKTGFWKKYVSASNRLVRSNDEHPFSDLIMEDAKNANLLPRGSKYGNTNQWADKKSKSLRYCNDCDRNAKNSANRRSEKSRPGVPSFSIKMHVLLDSECLRCLDEFNQNKNSFL